jgi:hypothetical protein
MTPPSRLTPRTSLDAVELVAVLDATESTTPVFIKGASLTEAALAVTVATGCVSQAGR